jgi:hypothetical protein
MHWGRKLIRTLGHLPVGPWEIQATPKAPSILQLSNHSCVSHIKAKSLKKLNSKPRTKIAVLARNVLLHPSMSCPLLERSSWYL